MTAQWPISRTTFKRSEDVKNYIVRWQDDSVSIRTLWLTDKKIKGVKLLKKYKGKYLSDHQSQRFSKETIHLIYNILDQEASKNEYMRQTVKLTKQ